MSPRLHTDFVEVKVHTAICDSCEKHNKLTLYRCIDCGLHICSSCWNKKSGDGTHVFNGAFRDVLELNSSFVTEDHDLNDGKENGNEGKTHARRRVQVISDDEDDDLPVLKPAPTINTAEATEASKQQRKRKNVIMNDGRYEDHDDSPRLWPIVPAERLPALRSAAAATDTSLTESVDQATQKNLNIHGEDSGPERQRIVRVYDHLRRPIVHSQHGFVGDQETNPQAHRPSPSSISNQQSNRYATLHSQPFIYSPQPGVDRDRQAARNQLAFGNNENTNRQAPRFPQPVIASQQTASSTPRHSQPFIYRQRPGVDVDRQAARNALAFADPQHVDHQAPRSGQASVSHRQLVHPTQASISQQHAQTAAANMDEVAVRSQQVSHLNQQEQLYAIAKQMEARNQQALSSNQSARPSGNRDQIATHNHQSFVSNQQSSAAARYVEQMVAAHDQNRAYLSRQQTNYSTPAPAQISVSHGRGTIPSPLPTQAFLSQQHAAHLASRQAQHRLVTQDRPNGPPGNIQVRLVGMPVPIN